MFIYAKATCYWQLFNLSKASWQSNSVSILVAALLVFTVPAWGQGDSDYLNAMDQASGVKEKTSANASSTTDQEEKFVESASSIELESLLSQDYPEEFALYTKFDAVRKNEVVAVFESTMGKAETIRVMRVINKIGLMGDSGGWEY